MVGIVNGLGGGNTGQGSIPPESATILRTCQMEHASPRESAVNVEPTGMGKEQIGDLVKDRSVHHGVWADDEVDVDVRRGKGCDTAERLVDAVSLVKANDEVDKLAGQPDGPGELFGEVEWVHKMALPVDNDCPGLEIP